MQINLNLRTNGVCPSIWSDFQTYSSPDSILQSLQSSNVQANQRGPLVPLVPCQIRWSPNRESTFTKNWQMKKPHIFFVSYIFMKVFGQQSVGLTCLGEMRLTLWGEIAIIVQNNYKYPFLLSQLWSVFVFTNSALLAELVLESPCPCVCLSVCLSFCLCHRVQFFSRPLIGPQIT